MFNSLRENLRINRSRSDFRLIYFTFESIYFFFFCPVCATEETLISKIMKNRKQGYDRIWNMMNNH